MSEFRKLQNGFTTIEQSNRLLESGLSADSADCYLDGSTVIVLNGKTFQETYNEDLHLARLHLAEYPHYIPCWSVGRLQEIAKISAKEKEYYYAALDSVGHQDDFVEWWVKHFTLTDNVLFDFSKLEE